MNRKLLSLIQTQKGLALISVLAMVTLATVIVLALFSVSDSEFKASKVYAGGNAARNLADSAVNLVIGQIRTASNLDTTPRIWSSQPGAIRLYNADGSFFRGYRLYSDGTMIVSGAGGDGSMANDSPPANWNDLSDQYVDLNEPVIRTQANGQVSVFFPIVDPRAADGNNPVEGFSYTPNPISGGVIAGVVTPTTGGGNDLRLPMPVEWLYVLKDGSMGTVNQNGMWVTAAGAGQPSEANPIRGRIAFWTDDEACRININTASEPGYWALPTFYHERDKGWADSPPAYHEYQRFPGHPATVALSTVLYPGPKGRSRFLDTYPLASTYLGANAGLGSTTEALNLKSLIYQIVPKINGGGSMDGTLFFAVDDVSTTTGVASPVQLVNESNPKASSKLERLYASLDEMIFSEQVNGNKRVENNFGSSGSVSITPATFEKSRFFLTAHSRAPELNIFGRPRIAMWPVPDSTLGEAYRTGYDRAVATVATLGTSASSSSTYYFSRKDADSAIADIGHDHGGSLGLSRNQKLMAYLDALTSSTFPGGQSFAAKYGLDSRQILVQIFDYIRCTNLYDSFLAPRFLNTHQTDDMDYRWQPSPPRTVPNDSRTPLETEPGKTTDEFKLDEFMNFKRADTLNGIVNGAPSGPRLYRTYTEPRFKVTKFDWHDSRSIDLTNEVVASGVYPGHGQVTPAEWTIDSQTFRGFGRFPTISEIGLQFICTADALNDEGSVNLTGEPLDPANPYKPGISGGRTAEKINYTLENTRQNNTSTTTPNGKDYWYSNFPPFPSYATLTAMGVKGTGRGLADDGAHPACDSENWNATLPRDRPLLPGQKRVQLAMVLEFFVPSMGFTKYAPEFTAVLNGEELNGIKVKVIDPNNGQEKWESVFNTTGNQVLKSNHGFIGGTDGLGDNTITMYPLGGSTGAKASMIGRAAKQIDQLPEDKGFDSAASSEEHAGWKNYPLLSSFFTVKRDQPLEFKSESPIRIDIYDDHNWQRQQPSQTLQVKFPESSEAPPPELVRYSTEKRKWEDASNGTIHTLRAVDACRWWAFHYRGALCNWEGRISISGTSVDTRNVKAVPDKTASGSNDKYIRTRGRFEALGHNSIQPLDSNAVQVNGTPGKVPANSIFYGYSATSGFNGTKSREQDRTNLDKYTMYPGLVPRNTEMGDYGFYGSDTVRSLVPKYGDYRLLAARKSVPSEMWVPHPLWNSRESFFAHNFGAHLSNREPGYHLGGNSDLTEDSTNRLVQGREYGNDKQFVPDMPHTTEARDAAARYRDFDNGPSNARDGAYINKPDEGNLSVMFVFQHSAQRRIRNAYFHDSWMQLPASESYFTPNRMISSPGMLGSLPTGVYGSRSSGLRDRGAYGDPWRTLLFRADSSFNGTHPGGAPPNGVAPADHYYMDLFWMPVIEPYAISDQWATAGKINMNFQIVPFTYIQRATAMYAAMKGELITAIPSIDSQITNVKQRKGSNQTKSYKQYKDNSEWPPMFFNEADGKNWHRYIDLEKTVAQMKYRMDSQGSPAVSGLFRSASQICEIHLVPQAVNGAINPNVGGPATAATGMRMFWEAHAITGDNTKERPYANLYQKLTTRSNTFRVYYRAQSLRKASRSLSPDQVNTNAAAGGGVDTVEAEYRGSALIERYLDMSAGDIPDYADGSNPLGGTKKSLDAFYRYRVLESKQFAP